MQRSTTYKLGGNALFAEGNSYEEDKDSFLKASSLNEVYNNFLLKKLQSQLTFSEAEVMRRPRIMSLCCSKAKHFDNTFVSSCAILDNFVLHLYWKGADVQIKIELRCITSATLSDDVDSARRSTSLKIDYFDFITHQSSFVYLSFKNLSDSCTHLNLWKIRLFDWLDTRQSPLLHRQPMANDQLGRPCNYAVSILIYHLMTSSAKTEPRKDWFSASDMLAELIVLLRTIL